MKSIFSISENPKITSVAIGKFDGVHLAHQKLFGLLDQNGCVLVIDKKNLECITPLNLREKLIPTQSYLLPFEEIHHWSGEEFVNFVCKTFPHLKKIIVGYDFCFGKNRSYGADDLQKLFEGEVVIVPEVKLDGIPLHSSIIKELIGFGDMALANKFLGYCYKISGRVVAGQNLGSKQLYPTINIKTHLFVLPGNGVYAGVSYIGLRAFPCVCFVGNRLSTDRKFSVETHILDRKIALEEKSISIEFVEKIRDNKHFDSLSELKKQITLDISEAKKILKAKHID